MGAATYLNEARFAGPLANLNRLPNALWWDVVSLAVFGSPPDAGRADGYLVDGLPQDIALRRESAGVFAAPWVGAERMPRPVDNGWQTDASVRCLKFASTGGVGGERLG